MTNRATYRDELITELELRDINPDDAVPYVFKYGRRAARSVRFGVREEAAVMAAADAVENAMMAESRDYGDGSFRFSPRFQTWVG